jgi:hypothetical protein
VRAAMTRKRMTIAGTPRSCPQGPSSKERRLTGQDMVAIRRSVRRPSGHLHWPGARGRWAPLVARKVVAPRRPGMMPARRNRLPRRATRPRQKHQERQIFTHTSPTPRRTCRVRLTSRASTMIRPRPGCLNV